MAGCSGSKPTHADNIRLEWMRHGKVPLSFIKREIPGQDDHFYYQITSYLNAHNSPGVIAAYEEKAIKKEFGDRYNTLIKDFQERTPFHARFKYLVQSAKQWCWLDSCKQERGKALEVLAYENWRWTFNLPEAERKAFFEEAFSLLEKHPELARNEMLVSGLRDSTMPANSQDMQRLQRFYRPLLWNDDYRSRQAAREAFSEEELKQMAEETLEKEELHHGRRPIYALEYLQEAAPDNTKREKMYKKYKRAASESPQNAFLNFAAGFCALLFSYGKEGDEHDRLKMETISYFEKAITFQKIENPFYYFHLADTYSIVLGGEYQAKTLEAYKKAVALDPLNVSFQGEYGYELTRQGQYEKAVEVLEKAVREDPGEYSALGDLYGLQNKTKEQLEAYQNYLKYCRDSDCSGAVPAAASLSSAKGYEMAMDAWKKVIEIDPLAPSHRNFLGAVLKKAGRLDEAIEAFEVAFRLWADSSVLWDIALIYEKQKDYNKVIETFERLETIREATTKEHLKWGDAYFALGKQEEAITHYRRGLELDAYNADLQEALQKALGEAAPVQPVTPPPPQPPTPSP